MPEEVRNAKLLLSKGLSDAEVAAIIGRSVSAVVNIRNGAYDFMLEYVPNDTPDDSRVYILLKSIDSRLYRQNEDMKKAIDQLVGLNSALVELQNEINVCSSCMTAMLDALNELKSKNSPQAEPEATPTKYPGKDFANWGEVIRRVEVYGDKFIADNLRGTKASLDGVTLYLACTPSTKKFLKAVLLRFPASNSSAGTLSAMGSRLRSLTCKNPRKPIGFYKNHWVFKNGKEVVCGGRYRNGSPERAADPVHIVQVTGHSARCRVPSCRERYAGLCGNRERTGRP